MHTMQKHHSDIPWTNISASNSALTYISPHPPFHNAPWTIYYVFSSGKSCTCNSVRLS